MLRILERLGWRPSSDPDRCTRAALASCRAMAAVTQRSARRLAAIERRWRELIAAPPPRPSRERTLERALQRLAAGRPPDLRPVGPVTREGLDGLLAETRAQAERWTARVALALRVFEATAAKREP